MPKPKPRKLRKLDKKPSLMCRQNSKALRHLLQDIETGRREPKG